MKVEKYIIVEKELEIVDAILLSAEEAALIPWKKRAYNDSWWLRSPGRDSSSAAHVDNDGHVDSIGIYVGADVYIRPALIIKNIEQTDFQIGDIFKINDWKFKIISDSLAWMYNDDIGCCAFQKNRKSKSANDYEKSDIKKYADNWFKNHILQSQK